VNFEGAIIELIQSGREGADEIVINPAGHSSASIAIFEKPIQAAHLKHTRTGRVAQKLNIVERGDFGYFRTGFLRLHRCDAVRLADFGQLPDELPSCSRLQLS
jgi:hypothetical protein